MSELSKNLNLIVTAEENLELIPRIQRGFYLIIVDEGWPTTASNVINESMNVFRRASRHHAIVVAKEEAVGRLRTLYSLNPDDEPIMVVTGIHPADYEKDKKSPEGLQISFGSLKSRDDIVRYLKQIASSINEEDFISSLSWYKRKEKLKAVLGELPILDLLSLGASLL